MPSTAFNSLVAMMRARPLKRDATIAEIRERFERLAPLLGSPPGGVTVGPCTIAGRPAERYKPAGAPRDSVARRT